MATTIDQRVALDEALVPSTKRLRIGRSNFRLHYDIQSKCARNIHAGILGDCNSSSSLNQIEHKKQKKGIEMYYPRFTKVVIHHFMSKDLSIPRRNKIIWHYVRDDNIFSTIKVVSRHQDTQQYGAILPIELTNEDIRNTTAYKEYYAYATGVAAPKPKASARKKRGDSDTSLTPPIATPTPITTVAPISRLSAAAKDEGTGSRPGVPDVPSDDSEEELSWNSFDDEDVDVQDKGDKNDESDDGSDDGNDDDNDETVKDASERDDEDDDNDDKEELAKNDDEDTESGKGGDEVSKSEGESDEEETRQEEEESFDPIPQTPKGSEDEGNDEEDQDLRLNSHVTLTPVHPDGLQESSLVSSFVTSMLNPISDAGVESIFTTASSLIVSLQTPTPIMTPSTIATIRTSSDAPIPPTTIPSTILENLPTFNSVFRFDKRLRSLETTFFEYRQTNLFVDVVSTIPGIVHQYMTQQITKAVREVVQIQTDRVQDSFQRENDEFLHNIDENMKKIIKGQVKSQVKEQVSRILPRIEESVNATLEAEVLTRSSHSSRTSYAVAADLLKMELKKILIEKMKGNKSIQ
nr:hypothetical protein [Tanacetum cinerariifolium]